MSGSCCAPHREHSSTVIELNECIVASFNFCAVSRSSYAAPATGITTHTRQDEVHRIETSREELLDQSLFSSLDDVREPIWWWTREYNEERPHDAPGDSTPSEVYQSAKTLLWNCSLDGKAYVGRLPWTGGVTGSI